MATLTTNIFLPLQKEYQLSYQPPFTGKSCCWTSPKRASSLCYSLPILFHSMATRLLLVKFNQNEGGFRITGDISKELYAFSNHYFFWFPEFTSHIWLRIFYDVSWKSRQHTNSSMATTSDFRHSDCPGAKRVFLRSYTQTFEIHGIDENWINVSILMADLIGDVVQPPAKIYPKISHWDVFFGSDKTRKTKNGRNLIRWGFEGGGTDHHPEMVWHFTVVDFDLRDQPNAALKHGHGSWKTPALVGPRPDFN